MKGMDENFTIRSYTKAELAHLYNPTMTYHCALRTFRRWLNRVPALHDELTRNGYLDKQHVLSPRQVEIIVHYLGPPQIWVFELFHRAFLPENTIKEDFCRDFCRKGRFEDWKEIEDLCRERRYWLEKGLVPFRLKIVNENELWIYYKNMRFFSKFDTFLFG